MAKRAGLAPYLTVKGGLDAIKFYENAFDADPLSVTVADDGQRVLHAELEINDGILYLSDEFPEYGAGGAMAPKATGGTSVTIHIELKTPRQVDRMISQAVAAGATVIMPAADTFWGARYGRLRDPFGHVWSISAPLKKKVWEKQQHAVA
jgi:PhnB protein